MKIIGLVFVFIIFFLAEVPKLFKEKQWWDLFVYLSFFMLSFILSLLLTLGIELPYVASVIGSLVKLLPFKF